MMTRNRAAAGLVAIVFTFACGAAPAASYDQSRSGSQIIDDASTALTSLHSAHVTIQSRYQGSASEFDADIENQNFSGTITLGTAGKLRMIVDAGNFYLYGPDLLAFSHVADQTVTAKVGEKWIIMPPGLIVDQRGLKAFSNFSSMADCIKSGSAYTKKGTSTIAGQSVVEVQDTAGSQIFVQLSAPHNPIHLVIVSSECSAGGQPQAGTIDLTRIGDHFGITPPANSTDLASVGLSTGA
jgi:hypothetical protein